MNNRILTSAMSIAVVGLLSACGGSSTPDPASPAGRLTSAMEAANSGDYDTFCNLLDPQDVAEFEATPDADCAEVMKEGFNKENTFTELEIDESEVTIDGDTATVPGTAITYTQPGGDKANEESAVKLVKRDEQWYFDIA